MPSKLIVAAYKPSLRTRCRFACTLPLLMERKTTGFLFLLLLLLAADVAVKTAEARYCFTQSHRFGGLCLSYRNCGHVCKTEGFSGGECRGFRRRCFCTKIC
ncbi:hypothetical protein CR513_51365, partial [Mucuna pruriens]